MDAGALNRRPLVDALATSSAAASSCTTVVCAAEPCSSRLQLLVTQFRDGALCSGLYGQVKVYLWSASHHAKMLLISTASAFIVRVSATSGYTSTHKG